MIYDPRTHHEADMPLVDGDGRKIVKVVADNDKGWRYTYEDTMPINGDKFWKPGKAVAPALGAQMAAEPLLAPPATGVADDGSQEAGASTGAASDTSEKPPEGGGQGWGATNA